MWDFRDFECVLPLMSHVTPYAFEISLVARIVELAAAFSTETREEEGERERGERERERERRERERERE